MEKSYFRSKQYIIMLFIKRHWLSFVIMAALAWVCYIQQENVSFLEKQNKEISKNILKLESNVKQYEDSIGSLKKENIVYIKRLNNLYKQRNEKNKNVDTMSISDLQSYFTKRYQ